MSSIKRKSKAILLPKGSAAEPGDLVLNTPNKDLYIMKGRKEFSNFTTITVENSTFEEWERCMIAQKLYIVLSENVEKGYKGWIIATDKFSGQHNLAFCTIAESTQIYCLPDHKYSFEHYDINPVIATDDKALNNNSFIMDTLDSGFQKTPLPKPSPQFINKYIKEFNVNRSISDISVDYVADQFKKFAATISFHSQYGNIPVERTEEEYKQYLEMRNSLKLKVDRNGYITISKYENSLTLKEICANNTNIRLEVIRLCTNSFEMYKSDDSLNDDELREKFENYIKSKI